MGGKDSWQPCASQPGACSGDLQERGEWRWKDIPNEKSGKSKGAEMHAAFYSDQKKTIILLLENGKNAFLYSTLFQIVLIHYLYLIPLTTI